MSNESKQSSPQPTMKELVRKIFGDEAANDDDIVDFYQKVMETVIEESKQSSPIGDVEQAAKDYADKHAFRVPYDGSNKFYDDVDYKASKEGFIAGSQWASPRPQTIAFPEFYSVLEENYQAQIAGYYNDDKTDEERKIRSAVIQEYQDLIAIYKHKCKNQTPAHPTAVNGDDEIALLNEIIKKQHELILSGERRGYEKAKQEFQPKAAAPKADVKSKEEILEKHSTKLSSGQYVFSAKGILAAMEEYANQFKSQP